MIWHLHRPKARWFLTCTYARVREYVHIVRSYATHIWTSVWWLRAPRGKKGNNHTNACSRVLGIFLWVCTVKRGCWVRLRESNVDFCPRCWSIVSVFWIGCIDFVESYWSVGVLIIRWQRYGENLCRICVLIYLSLPRLCITKLIFASVG